MRTTLIAMRATIIRRRVSLAPIELVYEVIESELERRGAPS
jgi:hypothetical protein